MKEYSFTEICECHDYTNPDSWADDSIDQYVDDEEEGLDPKLVSTTSKELSEFKISTMCGSEDSNSFKLVAEKYPDLKINTCISNSFEGEGKKCGSCMILINSKEQGEDISDLVDKSGGSLRFDTCFEYQDGIEFPMWAYFESE